MRYSQKPAPRYRRPMPVPSASDCNLWKQRLGQVPESVWDRKDLETLVLADNDLSAVPERIGHLKRLRMLDLGHNVLTAVPESLSDLEEHLDFLSLHDNRLVSLPESFSRLKHLRYLNISENAFEAVPECICGMGGLIELRAPDNPISSLPESLGQLTNLRELHLRNTKLRSLPEAVGGLHELRQLDLRGNPLLHQPAALARLPRLEKLDLRWVDTLAPARLVGGDRRARVRDLPVSSPPMPEPQRPVERRSVRCLSLGVHVHHNASAGLAGEDLLAPLLNAAERRGLHRFGEFSDRQISRQPRPDGLACGIAGAHRIDAE